MRSGSEASVCDGMCHAERCKARAQASCALASIASTNVFLMSCDEKVAGTCHAERQRSIRGDQAGGVAYVDASLPLSMTRERVFFMACDEKVAGTCHSERSEESEVGHASRLVEPDASLPLSMTCQGRFFTAWYDTLKTAEGNP